MTPPKDTTTHNSTPDDFATATADFDRYWAQLTDVGRVSSGGYRRFAWTPQDFTLREWFAGVAGDLGLDLVTDRNGNQWAWWGDPEKDGKGVVIGSHLDSVPDGGAFDGPLGVVSSFVAVKYLKEQGWQPTRPICVSNFLDEEGARFGVACAGSRLITGAMTRDRALALTDVDGVTMGEAMTAGGLDTAHVGEDPQALARVGEYIELHVEQGKNLADTPYAVSAGSAIWPHGRWRVDFRGCADHAGTTRLVDRNDPMLDLALFIQNTRSLAEKHGTVGTVGKVHVTPNGVNAIPSNVTAYLDARGARTDAVQAMVTELTGDLAQVQQESWTGRTEFDADLTRIVSDVLGRRVLGVDAAPILETGAGHDAGILANAGIPTTMMFVRNPTGTSHSPEEYAEISDCHVGVQALVEVLKARTGPDASPVCETATQESGA